MQLKDDEKDLLIKLYYMCYVNGAYIRDVINSPENKINHKRCHYLLQKWHMKDMYDYGVSLDLGWLTPKGVKIAKNHIDAEEGDNDVL